MNTELLMVIADAISGVALDYDIEIGPRGMVAMSASVLEAVEDHISSNEPDVVGLYGNESNDAPTAYDEGYFQGQHLGRRSLLEIYDSAVRSALYPVDKDFERGFRDALGDACE